MIIELFGPPGSGKTTLANQLAQLLCDRGHQVRIMRSYRQGKTIPHDPFGILLSLFRILAAIFTTCRILLVSSSRRKSLHLSVDLIRLIPPANWLWRIRLWRYILYLSDCWMGVPAAEIVIFDQGFVQAIGSLAMFHGSAGPAPMREALRISPPADIAIRIASSEQAVRENLLSRTRAETAVERLFDASVCVNMRTFGIFDTLSSELSALSLRRVDVNVDNIRGSDRAAETGFLEPLIVEIEEMLAGEAKASNLPASSRGAAGHLPTSPPAISQTGGI
jgi:energy-coupling factor transporter ATP-binding protein EcfA2